jgi:hypothetical protein
MPNPMRVAVDAAAYPAVVAEVRPVGPPAADGEGDAFPEGANDHEQSVAGSGGGSNTVVAAGATRARRGLPTATCSITNGVSRERDA